MRQPRLGILHPGAMGISVAATAQRSGQAVHWCPSGRSPDTQRRAVEHALKPITTLDALCAAVDTIVSVCPPHAAEEVATAVVAAGFRGLYIDANAISPARARRIGATLSAGGITFVDGGIIGGPAWEAGRTWLYLSGPAAPAAAACFEAGPLETAVLGDVIGDASALKMCFAAYSKGTTALLAAVVAAADAYDVRDALEAQWSRNGSGFAEETRERVTRVTAKAWRFAGEMAEIAATFGAVGLPDGFHAAAGDIYTRLAGFKDASETPDVTALIAAIRDAAPVDSGGKVDV